MTGPGRKITLSDLRAKVSSLRSRGEEFPAKAAPIEKECRTLGKLFAKVKEAKKERDGRLNKLRAKRKAQLEKLNRARDAVEEATRHHNALGCGLGGKLSKKKFAYCDPLTKQFNSTWINPFNNITLNNYRRRKKEIAAQIKETKAAYSKIQKAAGKRWKAVQRSAKQYK